LKRPDMGNIEERRSGVIFESITDRPRTLGPKSSDV
jgi:hypothetical protein